MVVSRLLKVGIERLHAFGGCQGFLESHKVFSNNLSIAGCWCFRIPPRGLNMIK